VFPLITPASLNGEVRIDWRREGLAWVLEVPLAQLAHRE
jgi:hypothetical protein